MPVYRVIGEVAIVGMVKNKAVLDELSKTGLDSGKRCFAQIACSYHVQWRAPVRG